MFSGQPLLNIIILNWNGVEDTIECLDSVRKNEYTNYKIILVDNGSENDNLEKLKTWCKGSFSLLVTYTKDQAEEGGVALDENLLNNTLAPEKLVLIENGNNLGFAAGNNVALRYVLKTDASFTILLNNDTVIEKDSLVILMNFMSSHEDYVAVTPQIRYFDPKDKIWNCGGKLLWFGNRKYYYSGDHISKVPEKGFQRITFITGCALLFKPLITGILTENFFFGEEDIEFSFRQKIAKRKMACCFSSIIYHKISVSFSKVNASLTGSLYIYYLSRLLNNKQFSSPLMFVIKIIINLSYAIYFMIFRHKIRLKQVYFIVTTILKELYRIDKIDKDYCLKSFKENFDHPINWNS